MTDFKSNLNKIVDEEKRGQDLIKAAMKEKEEKLNQVRDEATKEVNKYSEEMTKYLNDEKATVSFFVFI